MILAQSGRIAVPLRRLPRPYDSRIILLVHRFIVRSIAASLVLAVLLGLSPVAQAQSVPPRFGTPHPESDYAILNGHFFTQSAPGQGGRGYRVTNEADVAFWDAFEPEGGVGRFGYPLTRRFDWNGTVVQVFQNAAFRWLPTERRVEIRTLKDIGPPPAAAKQAELPLVFGGEAQRQPWSGWWWPANDVVGGPHLFDQDGPLERYDRYVESLGRPDPQTMEWERTEILYSGLAWAGHCNGWAAASLLEPEPVHDRTINGMTFTVADQKGLLSSYHFADSAAWAAGSEDVDVTAAEFHRAVTIWLGGERKGAILTFRPVGDEVWSYPAYKFEVEIGPDATVPDRWHVRMVVWLVDNDVPPGFTGTRPWPSVDGMELKYTLIGSDPHNPTGSAWSAESEGRFRRPFMVWYPDPVRRNIGRQLASPDLDFELVRLITRGPERKPLFDPSIRTDPSPPPTAKPPESGA